MCHFLHIVHYEKWQNLCGEQIKTNLFLTFIYTRLQGQTTKIKCLWHSRLKKKINSYIATKNKLVKTTLGNEWFDNLHKVWFLASAWINYN